MCNDERSIGTQGDMVECMCSLVLTFNTIILHFIMSFYFISTSILLIAINLRIIFFEM